MQIGINLPSDSLQIKIRWLNRVYNLRAAAEKSRKTERPYRAGKLEESAQEFINKLAEGGVEVSDDQEMLAKQIRQLQAQLRGE